MDVNVDAGSDAAEEPKEEKKRIQQWK